MQQGVVILIFHLKNKIVHAFLDKDWDHRLKNNK
jgi:hypothetical protein